MGLWLALLLLRPLQSNKKTSCSRFNLQLYQRNWKQSLKSGLSRSSRVKKLQSELEKRNEIVHKQMERKQENDRANEAAAAAAIAAEAAEAERERTRGLFNNSVLLRRRNHNLKSDRTSPRSQNMSMG